MLKLCTDLEHEGRMYRVVAIDPSPRHPGIALKQWSYILRDKETGEEVRITEDKLKQD